MLLSDLSDEFELYARTANRSPQTIGWYRRYVAYFARFLTERGHSLDCAEITTRIVREYVAALQERYAPRTVANHISSLKTVFVFGMREGLIERNPTDRVPVPKVPHREYDIFDPDDVDRLLRACDLKTTTGLRDFSIVMLLFDSGIRAAELVGLRVGDVDWERGIIRVLGKGRKPRHVPVSARTLRAIRRYLTRRGPNVTVDTSPLFLSTTEYSLTTSGLTQMLERIGKRTGLHVHPHKFRHSFAVNALRNDAREFDIQACLGRTTLLMTRHYARQSGEDLAKQHKRFSPADRLKVRV